jgi:hypothetical protein
VSSGPELRLVIIHLFRVVIYKDISFSLRAFDAREDLVRVLGPGERHRVVVPVADQWARWRRGGRAVRGLLAGHLIVRRRWAARSRRSNTGRPATRRNIRTLVLRLAQENP